MTEEQFWRIIAESREFEPSDSIWEDKQRQVKRLKELLDPLTVEEILQFDSIFTRKSLDACRWDLMGAFHLVDQGGDDGFLDFRSWLVSMGKDVYEAALNDPETLADVSVVQAARKEPIRFHLEFGEFDYAPRQMYEHKTGEFLYDNPYDEDLDVSYDPIGEEFDFDDEEEMKRRFPKLMAAWGGYRFHYGDKERAQDDLYFLSLGGQDGSR